MELQVLQVPPLGTNCYFLIDGKHVGIVDPGGAGDAIIRVIEENALEPTVILLTHGHFDHTGAAAQLKKHFHIPIFIHRLDAGMLQSARMSLAANFGFPFTECEADRLLEDGDVFSVGSTEFTVLHTPGHTAGSACFLSGDTLISGDTLFRRSIGRFERQDKAEMQESIRKLLTLDDGIRVFPGHDADTTIGEERRSNPFANFDWEWE